MILSHGIIAYTYVNKIFFVLLVQRRDTFAFIDFMMGKTINIKKMCTDERIRLLNFDFDELFEDMNPGRKYSTKIYQRCKEFFTSHIKNVRSQIKSYDGPKTEQPWGFPKGRSIKDEIPSDTAKREFYEETGIHSDIGTIKIEEKYLGDDNKQYQCYYYISKFYSPISSPKIYLNKGIRKTTVSKETLNCEWFTFDDALNILDDGKKKILYLMKDNIK